MNHFLYAMILVGLAAISGCQEAEKDKPKSAETPISAVEVTIDGNGWFPSELAGRWKVEGKKGWEIVFEKDGSILSVVHALGWFKLQPGKETIVPMKEGGQSILEPGPWRVDYNSATRVLEVEIVLDYFYCEIGDAHIEGDRRDIITGPVSDDGKTWTVNWTFFMDCIGITEDGVEDLSTDFEYGEQSKLVLKRQDE
jgi:hypothetical protein